MVLQKNKKTHPDPAVQSPQQNKSFTLLGGEQHTISLKAHKKIYCSRAKETEKSHLLLGVGQEFLLDQNHLLEGTGALGPRDIAPVRNLLMRMTGNALPLPNPSYAQSKKQQVTAIEYCRETLESVERDSPKGNPKEKTET